MSGQRIAQYVAFMHLIAFKLITSVYLLISSILSGM